MTCSMMLKFPRGRRGRQLPPSSEDDTSSRLPREERARPSLQRRAISDDGATPNPTPGTTESNVATAANDSTCIPEPVSQPEIQPVAGPYTMVVFDLKATSFSRDAELTQLAAKAVDHDGAGSETFSSYVLPERTKFIHQKASPSLTLSWDGDVLLKDRRPVQSMSQRDALEAFADWLQHLGRDVVLVAHKCFDPHIPTFLNAVQRTDTEDKLTCVVGFADSLPASKQVLRHETNHNLRVVYLKYFGETLPEKGDAIADVAALSRILMSQSEIKEAVKHHTMTMESAKSRLQHSKMTENNRATFKEMITGRYLSESMAKKMAESGLAQSHLYIAHEQDREQGIDQLLAKRGADDQPRVTVNARVIENVKLYCRLPRQ